MSTIAENIANIRARMNEAAKKAGRDPSEILLCAATKMNDARTTCKETIYFEENKGFIYLCCNLESRNNSL